MRHRVVATLALTFLTLPIVAFAADAATSAPAVSIDWLTLVKTYLLTPAAISGLCGFLAAILPQGAPGTVWGIARVAIDFIGANWGNAKNESKS
jgi:hypothetical protein